jgi:hypothetical protein
VRRRGEWFPARKQLQRLLRIFQLVSGEVAESYSAEHANRAVNRATADMPKMADARSRKQLRQRRENSEHRGKNILPLKSLLSESLF